MKAKGISHVAIGVSNMERSLHFYRDLLGLQVMRDNPQENTGGMPALFHDPQRGQQRRGVYLRWQEGPDTAFLVLSEHAGAPSGAAIKLDQVGIHHFSFWVEDLQAVYERVRAAGVPILLPPTVGDTEALGEPPGGKILSTLFQDPDGIIVQLDQRLS
jgi:catechol 2,3-dioxygenase-like lactoylglutathione lyase family enzyme